MNTMNTLIVLGLGLLIALSALSLYGKKISKQEEANLKQEEADKRRWVVEEQEASDEVLGTRYVGEVQNGMRNGQGTMTWSNGDEYVGSWTTGNRNGQGTMTWSNGDRYDGSWYDDKRTGQGTYMWSNGDKCIKNWQGAVTYLWSNGDKYVGSFVDSMPHFYGTKTWASGAKYEGQWSKHKPHGEGTMTYPDGSRYRGGFLDGKYHGFGIVTLPDGSEYRGVYTNGNYAPYKAPTTRSKSTPTAHSKLTEESGRNLLDAIHRLDAQMDGMARGAEPTSRKKVDAELAVVQDASHVSSLVNIGVGAAVGHVLAKAIFKSK